MTDDRGGERLPSLPDGEPILHRWFVLAMIPLVVAALVVSTWAFLSFGRPELTAAERRPPGTATITHPRGEAALATSDVSEAGPACASGIDLVGDEGARATARRAMSAACQLLRDPAFDIALQGLAAWATGDGLLRIAVFEATGLDSSARVEAGRIVIELNSKFQFDDASKAAPFIIHELVHLAEGWPGTAPTAMGELTAMRLQLEACDRLALRGAPPRGCGDAAELLADDDALERLTDAGYTNR